jgi:geranylgeranylglycerol-phosphate geranylgeranyltransferase
VLAVSVRDYLEIIRLPNSTLSGLGAVFAVLAYTGYSASAASLLVAFVTGFALTGAAMAVNDVADLEVDRVNKPWKPLPRGAVHPSRALQLGVALLVVGVIANTALGAARTLVAALYALIGVSYSYLRRHAWSHLLVAASTTGPVLYGYVSAGAPLSDLPFTVAFSATVLAATLGREFLKSIQDLEGDRRRGYRTLATVYGVGAASRAMLACCAGSAAGAAVTALMSTSALYKALIALAATLYAVSVYRAYKHVESREVLERERRNTLKAMFIGMTAFWLSKAPL